MGELLLMWSLGVIAGAIMTNLLRLVHTSFGTLMIDCSDPEKDTYSLEVGDLDKLTKKKRVELKVVRITTFSQK